MPIWTCYRHISRATIESRPTNERAVPFWLMPLEPLNDERHDYSVIICATSSASKRGRASNFA